MSFTAIRNICRVQRASHFMRLALAKRGYADEAGSGGLSLTFGTPHKVSETWSY